MNRTEPAGLTVVITATGSVEGVARILETLREQTREGVEILVVDHPRLGVPRLRRIGLESARGRVVVFLEDSCLPQPGWLDAWIEAFDRDPSLVAGSGLVEHRDPNARALDRSVVFCEYAPFLPPGLPGRPTRLAGNNFAVLREVALEHSAAELHETTLLAGISRAVFIPIAHGSISGRLGLDPALAKRWVKTQPTSASPEASLVCGSTENRSGSVRTIDGASVNHVRRYGWGEAFGDRFRFGFEFGRLRTVGASPFVRWAGLGAGPAIFGAQVARMMAILAQNRRHLPRFLAGLPITLALLASWSLGEWLGWSLGPPSARKPHGRAGRTFEREPGQARSPQPGYTPGPPSA